MRSARTMDQLERMGSMQQELWWRKTTQRFVQCFFFCFSSLCLSFSNVFLWEFCLHPKYDFVMILHRAVSGFYLISKIQGSKSFELSIRNRHILSTIITSIPFLAARECSNPTPKHGGKKCPGNAGESRDCNSQHCPVDGGWTQWTMWRKCTKSCGGGRTYRTRQCTAPSPKYGGDRCPGILMINNSIFLCLGL